MVQSPYSVLYVSGIKLGGNTAVADNNINGLIPAGCSIDIFQGGRFDMSQWERV